VEDRASEAAILRGGAASGDEPQLICNRERVVAAVIDAGAAERLQAMRARESQRSIADAFEEFRELVKRERYVVKIPSRRSRRDAFADALDHLSR
jgi:hypothetical protein